MNFSEAPKILIDIVGNMSFFSKWPPFSWVIYGNSVNVASTGWFYGRFATNA